MKYFLILPVILLFGCEDPQVVCAEKCDPQRSMVVINRDTHDQPTCFCKVPADGSWKALDLKQ